jgi:predicted DNA-binding antitoxin AbrB/MazE fold protein
MSIDAEYADGVLRPLAPLRLRRGERVRLILVRQPDPARWNLDRLARTAGQEDRDLAAAGLAEWAAALDKEDAR